MTPASTFLRSDPLFRNATRYVTSGALMFDLAADPNDSLHSFQQSYRQRRTAAAIVLCLTGTGMATVRALAQAGVDVHAFVFRPHEPIQHSRYARKVNVGHLADDDDELIRYLLAYAKQFATPPVVVPTSDKHALLLAKHRARLRERCRIWRNTHEDLSRLINKDALYDAAQRAGVPVIPSIFDANPVEIAAWSTLNSPPYLLKPPFEGAPSSPVHAKNIQLHTREALLEFLQQHGSQGLIVQRLMHGGDGHIYDCYGLSTAGRRLVGMASHRRLRQHSPDFGATCFGEIPSGLPPAQDRRLFEYTKRLLAALPYHGIFGVEWLHERGSDRFYLIDFNARPFASIGHLHDCGVNLPWLSYRDLLGDELDDVDARPQVKRKLWIDFGRDVETFRAKRSRGELTTWQWLCSLARCRSFAYFDSRDLGPGIASMHNMLQHAIRFAKARLPRRKPVAQAPQGVQIANRPRCSDLRSGWIVNSNARSASVGGA